MSAKKFQVKFVGEKVACVVVGVFVGQFVKQDKNSYLPLVLLLTNLTFHTFTLIHDAMVPTCFSLTFVLSVCYKSITKEYTCCDGTQKGQMNNIGIHYFGNNE